ncbi:hypothetical protein QBC40DRAFT_229024 [Triangularia verruculosa]|uniref:NACHT domain-containing protein n=1 Tax=Triangularia verruculosa TaxID=2587418 RepID=A0AAN6XG94_9PEZI|nr:hypothetical protein QBC40DRAFT_229024 [Triangularia verruculosa]
MATVHYADPSVSLVFQKAIRDFKKELKDDALYQEVLKTTSIDQVYDLAEKIQAQQGKTGHLRHLSKIQPFLEKMRLYSGAIDTFVQVQPDILALIWGPIKLLIQWTSTLTKSWDAIIKMTADIGDLLPEFMDMANLFKHNQKLNNVLALFFQDVLDFYAVTLKFFSMKRWRSFFEALWPQQKDKIELVKEHLERHTLLMRSEVRLEHIKQEHELRTKALEDFDRSTKERIRQDFHRIKTDTNPKTYDPDLYRVASRTCEGTGKWLLRDPKFKAWLDSGKSANKVLWLEGIPGAGKTFLAGTVITECQQMDKLIGYAFLTYAFPTTALSVLHSWIFQIASQSEDLQAALSQSAQSDMKHNPGTAASVLKDVLNCAGTTYLVIDGVDEIDKEERKKLLTHVLKLSQDCDNVRILACSRTEADIERLLHKIPRIRVDHRNSESIQTFVNQRSSEWLKCRQFSSDERLEVESLLSPLSAKSNGMFLYARVLMSYIELLTDIPEVRNALRVVPQDLNEVYARILERIKLFPLKSTQEKARKLLGFVGSSPCPLTVHELDQLLALDADELGARTRHQSSVNLNPVELCGPVVEVVDDRVLFVHFTVKEYLFSPEILVGLDKQEMTRHLAMLCLKYACHDHHDPELKVDEVQRLILHGSYRLHTYVETMWLLLVERCLSFDRHDVPVQGRLVEALERFSNERFNSDAESQDHGSGGRMGWVTRLQPYKNQLPHVYPLLAAAAMFRERSASSNFQLCQGETWLDSCPLLSSGLSITIHQTFDKMLCAAAAHGDTCCQYTSLSKLYGTLLFKCPYLECPFRRKGFSTRAEQRSHIKSHDRPWRCEVDGCPFAEVGFLSRRMQKDHHEKFHLRDGTTQQSESIGTLDLAQDDVQRLLFDLIRADEVKEVEALLPYFDKMPRDVQADMAKIAGTSGSVMMLKTLFQRLPPIIPWENKMCPRAIACTLYATEAANLEVMRWLLEEEVPSLPDDDLRLFQLVLNVVLKSDSDELFEATFLTFVHVFKRTWNASGDDYYRFRFPAGMQEVAGRADRALKLLSLWKRLPIVPPVSLSSWQRMELNLCLRNNAKWSWSIPLAKHLLHLGANINDTEISRMGSATALRLALRKSSAPSAEFAKFLLYRGADPECQPSFSKVKTPVVMEIGARELRRWLGISWEELVARVKEDLEKGICPPEYVS